MPWLVNLLLKKKTQEEEEEEEEVYALQRTAYTEGFVPSFTSDTLPDQQLSHESTYQRVAGACVESLTTILAARPIIHHTRDAQAYYTSSTFTS